MLKKKQILTIVSIAIVSFLVGTMFNMNLVALGNGDGSPWERVWTTIFDLQNQIDSLMQAQRELFPENLILRGLNPGRTDHIRDLIDETTRYHGLKSIERWQKSIDTTSVYIYNITFIYQKIPTNAYQILGFPVVSLEFNVTNTPSSATFWVHFRADLGKVSMTGEWTTLAYISGFSFAFSGENTDAQRAVSLFPYSPLNITINAYERLAIRITAEGHTSQGTTLLTLDILPSEILVDIPIVKNP